MNLDREALRRAVESRMDGRRFAHTLGVERAAAALGELYLPDRIDELRCAALLHDITKNETAEKQLQYLAEFDIIIDNFDEIPYSLYHSVTGAAVARRDFSGYAADDIVSAVRWHTTGRRGMTLFELLIYLADYIEEGREFEDCVRLREYFWDADPEAMSEEDRLLHLYRTAVMSFDFTVAHLISKNEHIDINTVECRNYYLGLIRAIEKGVINNG